MTCFRKMMIAALMGLGSALGYRMERALSATMAESRRFQLNLAILTVKLLKVAGRSVDDEFAGERWWSGMEDAKVQMQVGKKC